MISIIVLTRNEESNICKIMNEVQDVVKWPYEVIVVDASDDATPDLVLEASKKNNNIRLVPQKQKGYTNAIKTGLNSVRGEAVVVLVGDLSDSIEDINNMYEKYRCGCDIVCASRYMRGGEKKGGLRSQGTLSSVYGMLARYIIGVPTRDVSNSFKMYAVSIFDKITIEESGYAVTVQIILKAYFNGNSIVEIPTRWSGRGEGSSKFGILKQSRHYIYWMIWGILRRLRCMVSIPPKEIA